MKKMTHESKQVQTKEHEAKNKDLVGKNAMQRDAKRRPGPMTGRNAGEMGKQWRDHFGE